jgi:ParB family chromosome partitioning protein
VFAPEQAARLLTLKKNELAGEAGRLAVGTGWLPVMLRAPVPEVQVEPEAGNAEEAQEEEAVVADTTE